MIFMFYVQRKMSVMDKIGFYLVYDNWDDYNYKTSFTLYYFDGKEKINYWIYKDSI